MNQNIDNPAFYRPAAPIPPSDYEHDRRLVYSSFVVGLFCGVVLGVLFLSFVESIIR